jgi:predicted transposase YbfD/YdcC
MSFGALPDAQSDYTIESAVLATNRTGSGLEESYDISRLITDFEIYEHLNKPYLTGNIVFSNPYGIVQKMDMQGGETLNLSIKANNAIDFKTITKKFYVENIKHIVSPNQDNACAFRIVEDVAFISSLNNVNKSYTGSPASIIQKIMRGYLNKNVILSDNVYQNNMKVIIPNLHPLDAAKWISDKATNVDGLPFYFYSVFGDDNIRFYNLGTLLKADIINKKSPYVYWQSASQSPGLSQYTTVQSFTSGDNDNLLQLIRSGAVGSNYKFYDSLTGQYKEVKFNVGNDVFENLSRKEYFDTNQRRFNFGPNMKVNEIEIADYESKSINYISSSSSYKNFGDYKTIGQELDEGDYRKRVVGSAIKNFMAKTPMTIQVNGRDYISGKEGNSHFTIGNKIRFLVLDPLTEKLERASIDKKISGDYIIYAAKHAFKKERYDIQLLCTKLASYTGEPL